MRKYKILDHDLMSFERIMVWTNRTKVFRDLCAELIWPAEWLG
jgi:hypothetical protein